ncbi:hypothetical protein [Reichenbachiella sp.]|uniref:hypothetical protein n=1 Tax=Reichenbachiella sp. TaxID=2184521 RepID=UPI003BAE4079
MEISQETIIGFLTGTVATIILKGIVDFFQKRVEFKRELKKSLYDKKLDAAEEAAKAMFQNVQSATIIVNAIKNVLERDMDGELFEQIWEAYFKIIEQGESSLLNSTAPMYFQLDNPELWSNEDQQNLFDVYSKIKILGEEIQIYEDELDKHQENDEVYDELENYIENELRVNAKEELSKLKELLEKNSNAQLAAIEEIKKEFK